MIIFCGLSADVRPCSSLDSNCDIYVPSFTAVWRPYKATKYDSIFATMINFHDVRQQDMSCGSLWSDEGVYHLVKEIQFLQTEKFSNLFLGFVGFHFEKIVYGCVGPYLQPSGISSVSGNRMLWLRSCKICYGRNLL